MSCCGKGREAARAGTAGPAGLPTPPGPPTPPAPLVFEYLGSSRLTVFGRATGRRYHFDQYGARTEVDPRDATGLNTAPYLRRVPLDHQH